MGASKARRNSRVSARVVTALEHPLLVAHARLVVLGGDNARLREEVLVAGGALHQGTFKPLGSEARDQPPRHTARPLANRHRDSASPRLVRE